MAERIKIDQPIVNVSVVTDVNKNNVIMNTPIERGPVLHGTTYQIHVPVLEYALYLTINYNTIDGELRPLEIFINSKHMESYQWICALTRIVSAIFRKGGDYLFLIDELKSIFDPKGGFFYNKKYVNSLIAVIGSTIEQDFIAKGLLKPGNVEIPQKEKTGSVDKLFCSKCNEYAVVNDGGCTTCMNCGDSKCQ